MKQWLFDIALPWWAANAADRTNGGYVEQFTHDGADAGAAFRRTRVTCRQIYVFSHAYTLGFNPGAEIARHGVDFLLSRTFNPDTGCFVRRLTRGGDVLDPTPDLYDNAFALFALGWFHRATGDARARDWAHRTLDGIESKLRDRNGRGFWHEIPATGWRQQNPHMHLLEASLATFEATGESRFGDLVRELTELFAANFFDPATRTLGEYYTEDWRRAPGDPGRRIEPGHQFEWVWILAECRRLLGIDHMEAARALAAFAGQHGVDPATGLTRNVLRDDGAVIDGGSRTWPNTERIKAAAALFRIDQTNPDLEFASASNALFAHHLGAACPGLWIEAFDDRGLQVAGAVPATTLYHLFLAFAELLHVERARGHAA